MTNERERAAVRAMEAELRSLGRALVLPEPGDSMVESVMSRLEQEPAPAAAAGWQPVIDAFQAGRRWLRGRWRIATAVLIGALLVLLTVTPAGAKVREWLGFGAVVVVGEQSPAQSPGSVESSPAANGSNQPVEGSAIPLDQARTAVPFPIGVPAALGDPDLVTVSADARVVSMTWPAEGAGPIRLDQIAGSPDPYFAKKYYEDIEFTVVDGREALWLVEPHPIVVLSPDGSEQVESVRQSGPALVWQRMGVTLRLEGVDDVTAAVAIAESLQD